ncbi:hypothetical protein EYF80_040838 [Liparis tanakae]|uniref:Uncharacterized protein n=1 Tax=Liparis tanakae TaxID=230148 RepID=A0A4Z2G5V5_9TELE|nr:hypothetical protein EYF80_040838 [Liparis tanakae]
MRVRREVEDKKRRGGRRGRGRGLFSCEPERRDAGLPGGAGVVCSSPGGLRVSVFSPRSLSARAARRNRTPRRPDRPVRAAGVEQRDEDGDEDGDVIQAGFYPEALFAACV